MRRLLGLALLFIFGLIGVSSGTVHALSSDSKQFISGDNTFYSYVRGGETLNVAFLRANQEESLDTLRGDVTITVDGPGVPQQKCIIPAAVAVGQGCQISSVAAPKSGIWRVQFAVPAEAKIFDEVSPSVRWGKNLFSWDVTVKNGNDEQHGRTWSERYAIRQPPAAAYSDDFTLYYISEDGYIYKATQYGYNGQLSTLSADAIGIRKGNACVSAYQSTEVSDTRFTPALGSCGTAYKFFFEEPTGSLPAKAERWDGTTDWVRPDISRPSISELQFTSDNSPDQQSGTISFYLKNFIGQYQIRVDVDGDGSFDGQNDVTLSEQMKSLSDSLQKIRFDGTDKSGQIISTSQTINVKVDITKVAEIHLVGADIEGRAGGLELTRLNGENAPATRVCWNDTALAPMASNLMPKVVDGRDCPLSTGGVHGWPYVSDISWGNARYIDDWVYASAKLNGTNQIMYPETTAAVTATKGKNIVGFIIVGIVLFVLLVIIIIVVIYRRHKKKPVAISPPPLYPTVQNQGPQDQYRPYDGQPPKL